MAETEKSIESQMALQHVDCGAFCRFIEENLTEKAALYQCQRCNKYFVISKYQESQSTENNQHEQQTETPTDSQDLVNAAIESREVKQKRHRKEELQ